MAAVSEITSIEAQKQLLQAKNSVYRATLELQLHELRPPPLNLEEWVITKGRWPALLLLAAAPIAGFLAVRKGLPIQRLLVQGFGIWQIVDKSGLLQVFRKRDRTEASD